jgi:hypothetical protein
MSGPIVRKYGFPDFDRIFGKKEVPHGAGAGAEEPAGLEGEAPGDLVPDLPRTHDPVDAETASERGEIAPSTEFGQAGG